MAKPNALLLKAQKIIDEYKAQIDAEAEERDQNNRMFTRQLMMDCAAMVLNESFGFGEERLVEFNQLMVQKLDDFAELVNEDYKTDKEITYSKSVIDRCLQQIFKKNFQPWDVRMGATIAICQKSNG